jgi:hypothetical protein
LNQTFVVDGQCYFYDNDPFVTAYGVQYVPQYDNCSQCDDDYPNQYTFSGCCQVQDGSLVFSSYTFNLTGTTGPVVGEGKGKKGGIIEKAKPKSKYGETYQQLDIMIDLLNNINRNTSQLDEFLEKQGFKTGELEDLTMKKEK